MCIQYMEAWWPGERLGSSGGLVIISASSSVGEDALVCPPVPGWGGVGWGCTMELAKAKMEVGTNCEEVKLREDK